MHNLKILIVTILSFLFFVPAYCGSLTPPGEPDSEAAAMHTVEDLYKLAKYRTHTPKRTEGYTQHPFYPKARGANGFPLEGTGHTLDDVYKAIQKKVGIAQPTGTSNISTAGWGVPWPNPRYTIMIYGCDDLEVDTKYASDPDNARMNCYNDPSCCFEKNDTVLDNLTGLEWVRTPVVVDMGCVPWGHCGYRVGFYRYVLIYKYNNGTLKDLYVSDVNMISYYNTYTPGRFLNYRSDIPFLLPEDTLGMNTGMSYNYKMYEYPVVYSFEADPLSTPERVALLETTDWEGSVLPAFATYASQRTVEYTGPAGPDRDTSNEKDTIDGYEDWRAPTIREAISIIDFAYYDPALSNTEGTGQSYSMRKDMLNPPDGVESLFLSRGDPWINPSNLHRDYPAEEVYEGTYLSKNIYTGDDYYFGDTGMGRLLIMTKWIWPRRPEPWPVDSETYYFEGIKSVQATDGILKPIELDWLSFYRLLLVRNQGKETGLVEDHPR